MILLTTPHNEYVDRLKLTEQKTTSWVSSYKKGSFKLLIFILSFH